MGTITTLDALKKIADPDLSSIATKYIGYGSRVLRQMAPFYISRKDTVTDKTYTTDSVEGSNVIRPRYAKSGFSTVSNNKVIIELEERVHEVYLDHKDLEEDTVETELFGIQTSSYPVIQSLIKDLNTLLHDASNYVTAREVDVDATGTPANNWSTAPGTAKPLTNIRSGFTKLIASGKLMESDPNITLLISPTLAQYVVLTDEYKDEVADRKIIEPTLLKDRLEAVLNRRVILAEGFYWGEGGSAMFTSDATCHIIYVENPEGNYSDIQSYLVNNSTFLVGMRDLDLYEPPQPQLIGQDDIFSLSGNIIATWKYQGLDKVLEQYMKSLLRGTVWIHKLAHLVRLKDIV